MGVAVVFHHCTMLIRDAVCIGRRCLPNFLIEQLYDGPYQDLQAARASVLYIEDTHHERIVVMW